ncbi:MAG: hypothetical protein AAGF84_09530 [Planctomycetota bacterium]
MPDRTQQTLDDLADLFLTGTDAPVATPPAATPKPHPQPSRPVVVEAVSAPPSTDRSPTPQPADTDHAQTAPGDSGPAAAPRLEAVLLGNLPGMAHVWLTQYAQLLAEQDGPVLLLTVNPDHRHDGQPLGCLEAELVEPRVGDVLHRFSEPHDTDDDVEPDWFAPFPQTNAATAASEPDTDTEQTDRDIAALLGFDAARTATAEQRTPSVARSADSVARLLRDRLADVDPDRRVATVLIYCDTHPREIDRLLDVGVWTLLTGADPTAVAAAQFGLESLAEADPQSRAAEVGVFVVGSPPDKSGAAAEQIAAAASPLFDQPIADLGHLQKMRPSAVRTLGSFPRLDAQWAELIAALDALEPSNPALDSDLESEVQSAAPRRESIPEPALPEVEAADEVSHTERPQEPATPEPIKPEPQVAPADTRFRRSVLDDFFTRARYQPTASVEPTKPQAAEPREIEIPVELPPRISTKSEPELVASAPLVLDDSSTTEPDLVALLAGTDPTVELHALPVRCPEHPDLQLTADAQGRLHLLARLDDADHPRATLLSLTDARRWATRHRQLLALTLGEDVTPDDATDPVLHLFTDQPDRAVPLASAIDPTIRLHLLQHLPLDTGPTWLATPLQSVS